MSNQGNVRGSAVLCGLAVLAWGAGAAAAAAQQGVLARASRPRGRWGGVCGYQTLSGEESSAKQKKNHKKDKGEAIAEKRKDRKQSLSHFPGSNCALQSLWFLKVARGALAICCIKRSQALNAIIPGHGASSWLHAMQLRRTPCESVRHADRSFGQVHSRRIL